jgi:hypothetical protein
MNETLTSHLLKWQNKWLMQQAQHVTHMKLIWEMLPKNSTSQFFVTCATDVAKTNMLYT